MINVGIIGFGYSAKTFHLPLIAASEFYNLKAISSSQVDTVSAVYPSLDVYSNYQDMLSQSNLDLVIITAPNSVHYSIAMACLQHKCHVVLEKPMVTTSAEAAALIEYAKEQSLLLSVFHNRRWDGDFLTVKKLIADKAIGELRVFESHFDRFRPAVRQRWRESPGAGTGVWFDLGSHLVDQALVLFGLPEAVTARCLPLREGSETTDYFHVLLHYKKLEVILCASLFTAGPNRRFNVEGTQGSYIKYGLDPQEAQLKAGISPKNKDFGKEDAQHAGMLYKEDSQQMINTELGCYPQYYDGIAKAIHSQAEVPVSASDALNVMRIIELAEKSSKKGETLSLGVNH